MNFISAPLLWPLRVPLTLQISFCSILQIQSYSLPSPLMYPGSKPLSCWLSAVLGLVCIQADRLGQFLSFTAPYSRLQGSIITFWCGHPLPPMCSKSQELVVLCVTPMRPSKACLILARAGESESLSPVPASARPVPRGHWHPLVQPHTSAAIGRGYNSPFPCSHVDTGGSEGFRNKGVLGPHPTGVQVS